MESECKKNIVKGGKVENAKNPRPQRKTEIAENIGNAFCMFSEQGMWFRILLFSFRTENNDGNEIYDKKYQK
jgi:hypothetical protein